MGWGGYRNTPGGSIDDRSIMRKVTSGEIGAVDLGSVEGTGVSPGMKEITPERAAELSAMHEGRGPSVLAPNISDEFDGSKIAVTSPDITCPNCGHHLAVTVKMTGTMHG